MAVSTERTRNAAFRWDISGSGVIRFHNGLDDAPESPQGEPSLSGSCDLGSWSVEVNYGVRPVGGGSGPIGATDPREYSYGLALSLSGTATVLVELGHVVLAYGAATTVSYSFGGSASW